MTTQPTSSESLPTPDQRPGAEVVIYDGHCQFCTAQVRRLHWFDTGRRLAFVSLHDPLVQARYPDLTHEQLMKEMVVVSPAGRRYGGADGFRYLTLRLPTLWWLAPVMNFPGLMPIWSRLYHAIAVRRYRWNKPKDCESACDIHLHKHSR